MADDGTDACLQRITELAYAFYEARDAEARARKALTDEMLHASNSFGLIQETIAGYCDLRDVLENRLASQSEGEREGGEGGDWTMHRTSVQQFLAKAKARQAAA